MWILAGIVIIMILYWSFPKRASNQPFTIESKKPIAIGMYNMDLHIKYKKMYSETGNSFYLYASIFNEVLAYAAQGRTSDINYVYKEDLTTFLYHEDFISFMNSLKPDILAMSKIGHRVLNADMTSANIDFTSVGDFEDKLLRKSKAFMERFDRLNSIDLKTLYDENYSNHISI